MKTKKELKEIQGKLTSDEIIKIKDIINELQVFIRKPEISITGLRKLENCSSELDLFFKSYYWRVIRLLKQGDQVD